MNCPMNHNTQKTKLDLKHSLSDYECSMIPIALCPTLCYIIFSRFLHASVEHAIAVYLLISIKQL